MRARLPLLLVLLTLLAAACGSDGGGQTSSTQGELLVAAAADLSYAFDEIGALFEAETGAKVTFSYGSSGLLASQIEGGLPADIYSSAGTRYVDQLREKGLIVPDSERVYALGRLALASSTKAGLTLTELSELEQPEVKQIAIANPQHAPYGRAAQEALKSAGLAEHDLAQLAAVDLTVLRQHLAPEGLYYLLPHRSAGPVDLVTYLVGVEDRGAFGAQHVRDGGLAAADAPGNPNDVHQRIHITGVRWTGKPATRFGNG